MQNLAVFGNIYIVDKSSADYFTFFNQVVFGVAPFYLVRSAFFPTNHILIVRTAKEHGREVLQLRYFAADDFHIAIQHVPSTSLAEPLVRFRCVLCPEKAGVACKPFYLGGDAFTQRVSRSNHQYQHKHPPEYPECREETARFGG